MGARKEKAEVATAGFSAAGGPAAGAAFKKEKTLLLDAGGAAFVPDGS